MLTRSLLSSSISQPWFEVVTHSSRCASTFAERSIAAQRPAGIVVASRFRSRNRATTTTATAHFTHSSRTLPLSSPLPSASFWTLTNRFEKHGSHNQHQRRNLFIQTADTPNPESIKFIPTGIPVLIQGEEDGVNGFYLTKQDPATEILRSPLAKQLFDVQGVKAVYFGADFVTVTKYAEAKWKFLRPSLLKVLMDWADSGKPAVYDHPVITDTTILDDDDEVVAMIKELMEARIRPAVQEDGGDIRYVGFDVETGIVTVKLAGSCVGCPSSSVTLKQGVENMLMHYIPEVTGVSALEEEDEEVAHAGTTLTTPTTGEAATKQKSYEERLAAADIPFAD